MSSQPNGPGGHDSGPADDSRAREGYHDPTAGIAGAAPARSALTLRLVLAAFGFIVCSIGAALAVTAVNAPAPAAVLAFLAAVAVAAIPGITHCHPPQWQLDAPDPPICKAVASWVQGNSGAQNGLVCAR
jgi:hypothetical protein